MKGANASWAQSLGELRNLSPLLILALGVSALFRLRLSWNGPHLDEADYLFVGRLLWNGGVWPSHSYIFSSDLPHYLLGLGDALGGLVGGRIVASLLGLASLVATYQLCRALGVGRRGAWGAVILLAVQASHVQISRLATYDMPAFLALAAALWALAQARFAPRRQALGLALLASLLLALAVLCKYVTVLLLPVVPLFLWPRQRRLIPMAILPAGLLLACYGWFHVEDLQRLVQRQILGVHAGSAPRGELLVLLLAYLGLPLLLWALAVKERLALALRWEALFLALFALPMPAYHLLSGGAIALEKHLVYSHLALAPPAGALLARLGPRALPRAWLRPLAMAAMVLLVLLSTLLLRWLEQTFPDTRPLLREPLREVGPTASVLSEDPYLFHFALYPDHEPGELHQTVWFDPDLDGVPQNGELLGEVRRGRFEWIFLSGQVTPALARSLEQAAEGRYAEVFSQRQRLTTSLGKQREAELKLLRRIEGPAGGSRALAKSTVGPNGPQPGLPPEASLGASSLAR